MNKTVLHYTLSCLCKHFLSVLGVLTLPILWFLLSDLFSATNQVLVPRLEDILHTLMKLLSTGEMSKNLTITLYRFSLGLCLGTLCGIFLGCTLSITRRFYDFAEFPLEFLRAIPVLAVFPLFLLIFGLGDESKIAIAAFPSALVMAISTHTGILRASGTRVNMALLFGATRWQLFSSVLLFECLPEVVMGLRIALSLALTITVASEMFIGTELGVGQRIFDAYLIGSIENMYAYLLVLGCTGYLLNKSFLFLESKLLFWIPR